MIGALGVSQNNVLLPPPKIQAEVKRLSLSIDCKSFMVFATANKVASAATPKLL